MKELCDRLVMNMILFSMITFIFITFSNPLPTSKEDRLRLLEIRKEIIGLLEDSDSEIFDVSQNEESEDLQRQTFFSGQETCETTGFENITREECEEVSEIECKPIVVTKYRTEIVPKCEIKTDDKSCNVTVTTVPKQECVPKQVTKCDIDYSIVEEEIYEEECHIHVQHLCEEYVPVPVHVPVAIPEDHYNPEQHNDELQDEKIVFPRNIAEPLFSFPSVDYKVKRETRGDLEREVEKIVRQMLQKGQLRRLTESSLPNIQQSHLVKKIISGNNVQILTSEHELRPDKSTLGAPIILPLLKGKLSSSLIGHHHHVSAPPVLEQGGPPVLHHEEHPPLPVPIHPQPHPHPPHGHHKYPPIITNYELPPQEPGCRSIATKTCENIPHIVAKKVPHEICKKVPDIECFNVIKEVPELECTPRPYEASLLGLVSNKSCFI